MMTEQAKQAPVGEWVSEFELQDRARRRNRITTYDRLAGQRDREMADQRYYSQQVQRLVATLVVPGSRVLEIGCGLGDLLAAVKPSVGVGIDVSPEMIEIAKRRNPDLTFRVADVERDPLPEGPFDFVICSDVIGHLDDIQRGFERIHAMMAPNARLIVTYYNFAWEPVLKLAERFGLKTQWPEQNWVSLRDIVNLLQLSDFSVVREGTDILLPLSVPGLSDVANRVVSKMPIIKESALVNYVVARPAPEIKASTLPSVSVICPCRNEKGNIRDAIERTPMMGPMTELIFVDGNSSDGTREEIQAQIAGYRGPLKLSLVDQGSGKGKGDAVRKGFAAARGDVLMILDSDLTVIPEDLPKFYRALVTQKGDFINGVRLVYPMEGQAMRFLNLVGNKFFSFALSWLLEQPVKDSLCGTKVLYRRDYERIAAHRAFFGEFDPFGDFDLLFGAARLNLKIVDLPIRYRARTYGDTKISRFSHGMLLLKMTAFGFRKLRMGA